MSHRLNYRTTHYIHSCKYVTRKSFLGCKKRAIVISQSTVKIRVKTENLLLENIKKMLSVRVPAKASAWYIGSSVLAKGISALVTPIFTRLLTPEEYGLYPLYLSWLSVFTILLSLELTGGVMYRGLQKFGNDKDEFTSA